MASGGHLDFKLTPEKQAFAAEHVRLAYSEAHRFSRRTGIAYEDLIGAAHIGLAKGAHRFDPSMGYKPSTYLVSLIRGELLHYCRDRTYLLRISHRLRELWMKGRKLIPYGHSDIEIAKELNIELTEWLECRHVCSGPPVELNDTVHEINSPGYHGKPQLVEDDRTEHYFDAVRKSWEAQPAKGAQLFWNVKGHLGNAEQRVDALAEILNGANDILEGGELSKMDTTPLAAASFGGDTEEIELTFEEEDLGNGRVQPSLF